MRSSTSRRWLDAILARKDLSTNDRNVFEAQRAQVAASIDDFALFATRRRLCANAEPDFTSKTPPICVRDRWDLSEVQAAGRYDGPGRNGQLGFGEDARAIIDRAPLADRIALSRNPRFPARLRLDIALTTYARAVQLQDNAAIDRLSKDLSVLLPLMAEDFRAIAPARPGPDKRFAEFVVLAKIPGLRTDLADYVRPEGRRVADFHEHWTDWVLVAKSSSAARPPPLIDYQEGGSDFEEDVQGEWPDRLTDLTCLGECGRGSAPLRLPDFITAQAATAAAERGFFFKTNPAYDQSPPALPPGAIDVWDEMLTYAGAHPYDPRIPETLHWLVHVGHFGGSHNHSGHRAFMPLHARYPNSYWAKKTPYYND